MLYRTLGAAALLIATFGVAPAISADTDDEPSLLALQSRAVMSGRPVRVIVEFAEPQASVPAGLSGVSADRIKVGAMRGRQAEILARVFGVDPMRTRAGNVNATLMDHLPMMAVEADADDLARLAADPSVKRIVEDGLNRPSLNQSVGIINMKGSGGAYSRGATGAGRAVAVIDTGVKKNHEFLSGKVISEACFSTNDPGIGARSLCGGGVAESTAAGSASDCPNYIPGCGHGTHVAAIAAGRNTSHNGSEPRHGVARNAGIVAIKVFTVFETVSDYCGSPPCLLAYDSDIIRGLERVYDLRGGVSNRKIDAVNLSLGGGIKKTTFCSGNPLASAVKKLRAADIATVIASGNSGFKNGVSARAASRRRSRSAPARKKPPENAIVSPPTATRVRRSTCWLPVAISAIRRTPRSTRSRRPCPRATATWPERPWLPRTWPGPLRRSAPRSRAATRPSRRSTRP
jgi:serine protease